MKLTASACQKWHLDTSRATRAGRKAIKSKWVFKHKADGRFRACLVAKGFTQIFGMKTMMKLFSPVARFKSLRLLLALAALEDWEIHQMDVKLAFLNGLLDEEIYMEQPQGFIDPDHPHKVCLLKKSNLWIKAGIARLEPPIPWSPY